PDRFIAEMSKEKRKGKIFLDFLRNGKGATSVACYSTRARKGAPVATPVTWSEVSPRLRPDKYTVVNLPNRLTSLKSDPWKEFFDTHQPLIREDLDQLISHRGGR